MSREQNPKFKSAVALKYDATKAPAPKVTAKGEGLVGKKIISLALENNIPIKEDPDLIQMLAQVDIDEEIPASVYQVVAELLAFVYQVNKDYKQITWCTQLSV